MTTKPEVTREQRRWEAGLFEIATIEGRRMVQGWINGLIAIDRRRYQEIDGLSPIRWGYVLNHIPTGHSMLGYRGPRKDAMRFAEQLAASADWNFSNPAAASRLKKVARAVMEQFPRSTNLSIFEQAAFSTAPKSPELEDK